MRLFDNIKLAIENIWCRKMRSFLTMLGIIIGIGSVIAIVTVGNSLTSSINSNMASLGINNVTISVTQQNSSGFTMLSGKIPASSYITDDMIEHYKQYEGESIETIALTESAGTVEVYANNQTGETNLMGVNEAYFKANDRTMLSGNAISSKDIEDSKKVCNIPDTLAEDFFKTKDVVGKTIDAQIDGNLVKLYITGVFENSGNNDEVYAPISTIKKYTGSDNGYRSITVVTKPGTDSETFVNMSTAIFESMYKDNDEYTVKVTSVESMIDSVNNMLASVQTAIGAIAAISLLVGGIGVMNIMLVSITERTREIGTRKAIGATAGAIRVQFIIEAVILCMIGGIMGVLVGVGLGAVGAQILGYPAAPSVAAIVGAVAFSMAIGVFFGYYPANKAAKLNPIDALRYE